MRFLDKFRRITSSGDYIPEIDGFRFVAIMWVLLFHSLHPILDNSHYVLQDNIKDFHFINLFFANGFQGVELFFVISGLILGIPFAKQYILKEKKVNIKKYFLRRITRLEPPYILAMCFFFVVLIIKGDFKFFELLPSLGASLIYLHNIIFQDYPYITMVAWSLEIEVQFYLIAPLLSLVFLLPALYRRLILIALIALFPVVQWYFPLKIMTIYSFIEFFLSGLLLADLYVSSERLKPNYLVISSLGLLLILPILFINHESSLIYGIIYPFLVFAFFFLSLHSSIWNSFFKIEVVSIIGGMCYSIYLLHFVVIAVITRFSHFYKVSDTILPNLIVNTIVVLVVSLFVSAIYFKFVEQPFMDKNFPKRIYERIKNRLS